MAFIRDGTALAYYFGIKIWDIADLTLDTSSFCKACEMGQDDEPLFCVLVEHR